MKKQLSNFVMRTITGSVFVLSIIASLYSLISFWILLCVLAWLAISECADLLKKEEIVLSKLSFFVAILPILMTYPICISNDFTYALATSLAVFVFGLLTLFSFEIYKKKINPIQNTAFALFVLFYIALPFCCLIFIYRMNPLYAFAVFALVWLHDTFSYLVGMRFGKTKFFERISPKKTWEGFWGGLVVALLTVGIYCFFTFDDITRIVDPFYIIKWLGLALVIVVAGTLGDLFESLFKRGLNVKDSGKFLPGHGGLLDRLDSIFFAAPMAIAYLILINTSFYL